jgi:hypothetical protein
MRLEDLYQNFLTLEDEEKVEFVRACREQRTQALLQPNKLKKKKKYKRKPKKVVVVSKTDTDIKLTPAQARKLKELGML